MNFFSPSASPLLVVFALSLSMGSPATAQISSPLVASVDRLSTEYPVPHIRFETYFKASNSSGLVKFFDNPDSFGFTVAVSGNTLVIGAPGEDSNSTLINGNQGNDKSLDAGAAYVFIRRNGLWVQQAYLKPFIKSTHFGNSVAIDGDTIVVGAEFDSDSTLPISFAVGAAHVFKRTGSKWTQEAYLKATNAGNADLFGTSVAISGETIAVGAIYESSDANGIDGDQLDNSALQAGAVYIYSRDGMTWTQSAYLKASNSDAGDHFGTSVSLARGVLAVGANGESSDATGVDGGGLDNNAPGSGAVYLFSRTGSTWVQEAYLKASNTDAGDKFGSSVSLSSGSLVVGATGEASSATGVNGDQHCDANRNSGAAYLFKKRGSTWSQQAYLKASNSDVSDLFGGSVSLVGAKLIVGAVGEQSASFGIGSDQFDNSASRSGAAYVFVQRNHHWEQSGYIKAPNSEASDAFGSSVALGSHQFFVGASGESSDADGLGGDGYNNDASGAGAVYSYRTRLQALESNVSFISLAQGGRQELSLNGGPDRAGWHYRVLGSMSPSSFGVRLQDEPALPLTVDRYFELSFFESESSIFDNFKGRLDGDGRATATLTLPPGLDSILAGTSIVHAFVASPNPDTIALISGTVTLALVP